MGADGALTGSNGVVRILGVFGRVLPEVAGVLGILDAGVEAGAGGFRGTWCGAAGMGAEMGALSGGAGAGGAAMGAEKGRDGATAPGGR